MNKLRHHVDLILLLLLLPFVTLGGCATGGAAPTTPALVASVVSEPAGLEVAFRGKTAGQTPLELSMDDFDDLVLVSTLNDEPPVVERRIRVLSPERVEIQIRVSGEPSPLAKVLGLSRVTVFDYGDLISFDSDRYELKPELLPLLRRQASLLNGEFVGVDVYVCGHTDAQGGQDHNLTLSLNRAQSVATFLRAEGVAEERLKIQGFGPNFPLAGNDSGGGRALNRRTEIILPD